MITHVTGGLLARAQRELYSREQVQRELIEELFINDDDDSSDAQGTELKHYRLVVVFADVLLETFAPLAQTIESLVGVVFSALATVFYSLCFEASDAKDAAKCTLINSKTAIQSIVRFIGKVALLIPNLLGQGVMVLGFGEKEPLRKQCDLDGYKTRVQRYIHKPMLTALFGCQRSLAHNHPIAARFTAIPLAAVDTIIGVLNPLLSTVELVIEVALKTLLYVFLLIILTVSDFCTGNEINNKVTRDYLKDLLKFELMGLNAIADSLAQAVSNAAVSPLTFIGESMALLYDPKSLPASSTLYRRCYPAYKY